MKNTLSKIYSPKETEDKIYKFWMGKGYFKANPNPNKKPFTIMMPPPNITGNLHLGHALDCTLQDILTRFKRMQGFETLWQPGTDHAAIATEAKIVEQMRSEGLTKEDIGYEGFMKRAFEWKEKYGGNIVNQFKKLGSSCDWSRERFTMDEGCNKAVREFFIKLYEKGLIYRGEKIINWCTKCQTTISDIEVEFEEKNDKLYYVKYPFADGNGFLEVATTRPETIPGDTALAINPEDERAKYILGKKVIVPIFGQEILIIADENIEKDFGTGVLKVTPAHAIIDFEIGERHNLEIIDAMDNFGNLNENAHKYAGMERFAARKIIVKDLEEQGFISKIEDMKHNVGTCQRCSTVIEPRISKQWFVKMKTLAEPAIKAVKNGDIKFVPERFSKIYFSWMENIKDWCISRQLWWGHRIPAYICKDCNEVMVSRENVKSCLKCNSKNIEESEETLDTWFSAALWPFSTLGWPEKTPEFKYFFPTDVLVTGRDLIFFWIARMIFSSLEMTDKRPFEKIVVHGLVLDGIGRKMSKSLGNGIDPLDMIEKYGSDALRFTLITGNSPGNDIRFSEEKIQPARNFANKIWNAARFIHMLSETNSSTEISENKVADNWILSKFNKLAKEVTTNLEKYEFGLASAKIYDFFWNDFCDWYIEFSKIAPNKKVLISTFCEILKLLHPFMPFITEEIWKSFPQNLESIMICKYPKFNENLNFESDEKNIEAIIQIIRAVRNRRAEMNVSPSKKTNIYIETNDNFAEFLQNQKDIILKFASAKEIQINKNFKIENSAEIITDEARIYLPLDELIDKESEEKRIQKEIEVLEKQLEGVKARIANQEFISKAPENIIAGAKEQKSKLSAKLEELKKFFN